MQELERLGHLDDQAGRLKLAREVARAKGGLVLGHMTPPSDPADMALGPDLGIRHVRLREGEAAPGAQDGERVAQRELHVEVVQDAHADDRVELPALEARAGLRVAHHHLDVPTRALAAERRGRLAQLECGQLAPGLGQTGGELACARPQLEAADAGSDFRGLDQELSPARGADAAGRAGPAPDVLEARGNRLALQRLARIALLGSR